MKKCRTILALIAAVSVLAGCVAQPSKVGLPATAALPGDVCHRVSENLKQTVRCRSPQFWAELAASAGFACLSTASSAAQAQILRAQVLAPGEARKGEVCATAQEWKRIVKRSKLRNSTERATLSYK